MERVRLIDWHDTRSMCGATEETFPGKQWQPASLPWTTSRPKFCRSAINRWAGLGEEFWVDFPKVPSARKTAAAVVHRQGSGVGAEPVWCRQGVTVGVNTKLARREPVLLWFQRVRQEKSHRNEGKGTEKCVTVCREPERSERLPYVPESWSDSQDKPGLGLGHVRQDCLFLSDVCVCVCVCLSAAASTVHQEEQQ